MLAVLQALLHVSITYLLLVIGGATPVLQPLRHGSLEFDKFIVRSDDLMKFNFLITTFYFPKSEFHMKCDGIPAVSDQFACHIKALRLIKLRQQLTQLRAALQRTSLSIHVSVTVEGFASVDQDTVDYDNVGLSNDRARSIYDELMDGEMAAPPALKNFVIKPVRKGVYVPKEWWAVFDDGLARAVDVSEETRQSLKDQLAPRLSRCDEGIGLELPRELQKALFQKLRLQKRVTLEQELEKGRKVEVWVRTDSVYVRNYINSAHNAPDCIMEPKKGP